MPVVKKGAVIYTEKPVEAKEKEKPMSAEERTAFMSMLMIGYNFMGNDKKRLRNG